MYAKPTIKYQGKTVKAQRFESNTEGGFKALFKFDEDYYSVVEYSDKGVPYPYNTFYSLEAANFYYEVESEPELAKQARREREAKWQREIELEEGTESAEDEEEESN